jgi:hypothetical protein
VTDRAADAAPATTRRTRPVMPLPLSDMTRPPAFGDH